jgi:cyanobactin maturation PatA/PatG family protease
LSNSLLSDLAYVWSQTKGVQEVCIAILDTDVNLQHPTFSESAHKLMKIEISEFNASSKTEHGTYVASLIFGNGSKAIAPHSSGILIPIYKDTEHGLGTTQEVLADAIDLAVKNGANIINISGGLLLKDQFSSLELARSVERCINKGIQIVASVGNDACDCLHVPASLPGVLAAAVSDENNYPFLFNNYGSNYQKQGILTPLSGIFGAISTGGYQEKIATSYAAPVLSGVIALLCSLQLIKGEKVSPTAVAELLIKTSDNCPLDTEEACKPFLAGSINLKRALEQLFDNKIDIKKPIRPTDLVDIENISFNTPFNQNERMENNNETQERSETEGPSLINLNEKIIEVMPKVKETANVLPSDCGCSTHDSLIYMIGNIGFAFPSRSRRSYFDHAIQKSSADNPSDLLEYLEKNPFESENLIWTLVYDDYPLYAIKPEGPFASHVYTQLRGLFADQLKGKAVMVSLPGHLKSKQIQTEFGQSLSTIAPAVQGIKGWDLKSSDNKSIDKGLLAKVVDFTNRIVYDFRNGGIEPKDRAINFAVTESLKIEAVFEKALKESLELSTVTVDKSPISRPDTVSYDVKLTFFHPQKRMEVANKVFKFSIDVSDVIPMLIGEIKVWSEA